MTSRRGVVSSRAVLGIALAIGVAAPLGFIRSIVLADKREIEISTGSSVD